MGLASPPCRQPARDQLGHPLPHRKRVNPGQRIAGEGRKDLLVEQLAGSPGGRVAQRSLASSTATRNRSASTLRVKLLDRSRPEGSR